MKFVTKTDAKTEFQNSGIFEMFYDITEEQEEQLIELIWKEDSLKYGAERFITEVLGQRTSDYNIQEELKEDLVD